jgi:transposase-like protein
MPCRLPLTPAEREYIYHAKLRGQTLAQIAADLSCSVETVRKWWRYAREHGRTSLHRIRRGRPAKGILSQFAPLVIAQALARARAAVRPACVRSRMNVLRECRGFRSLISACATLWYRCLPGSPHARKEGSKARGEGANELQFPTCE